MDGGRLGPEVDCSTLFTPDTRTANWILVLDRRSRVLGAATSSGSTTTGSLDVHGLLAANDHMLLIPLNAAHGGLGRHDLPRHLVLAARHLTGTAATARAHAGRYDMPVLLAIFTLPVLSETDCLPVKLSASGVGVCSQRAAGGGGACGRGGKATERCWPSARRAS